MSQIPYQDQANLATWVDCIVNIIGWFQISDQLNPSTNKYKPESGPNGLPISGPGWVAYERSGASPGDIVIIYRLQTLSGFSGSQTQTNAAIASVLWNLLNPCGLSYWTNEYNNKSCVSRTDLSTYFPHPGGILSPNNPDNPNGDPDILWKNVTTQYGLPGPGNINKPFYIRDILPGFGIRVLVWSDSCCAAANTTTQPPIPPVIILPPVIPPISPPVPGIPLPPVVVINPVPPNTQIPVPGPGGNPGPGPVVPGGPGPGTVPGPPPILVPGGPGPSITPGGGATIPAGPGGSIPIDPDIGLVPSYGTTPALPITPGGGAGGKEETIFQVGSSQAAQRTGTPDPRRPGSSPIPRGTQNSQISFYDVPSSSSYYWRLKTDTDSMNLRTQARPFGSRYNILKEGGLNYLYLPKSIRWVAQLDIHTLNSLGLNRTEARESLDSFDNGVKKNYAPAGRNSNTVGVDNRIERTEDPNTNKSITDPTFIINNANRQNTYIKRSTQGGNTIGQDRNDISPGTNKYLIRTDGQIVSIQGNKSLPLSRKSVKETNSGRVTKDSISNIGALTRRSIELSNSRTSNASLIGSVNALINRYTGPGLKDIKTTREAYNTNVIKDKNKRFSIHPIILEYSDSPKVSVLVTNQADGLSEAILLLNTNIYTNNGILSASLGNSGIMTFGRINPPTPGMYVVATPTCLPGQGSLPDIIAGGQTWSLMTLVMTLINIEGAVIAQQIMNFLPTLPGDLDVVTPNRLPKGLMTALEMDDTSHFIYDGTFSATGVDQSQWWNNEPHIIFTRSGSNTNSSVSIVLKATINSLTQDQPFRPVIELYENNTLLNVGAVAAFIGGPCNSLPGWYNLSSYNPAADPIAMSSGAINTSCIGGAGGTNTYTVDSLGQILSGPYNPAVYGGTHHNYLYFKYDPNNPSGSNSSYINAGTYYRLRVYNNGPVSDKNGYVIFTKGLSIPAITSSLSIDSTNKLDGTITTYHCNQVLKVVNMTTMEEIERRSNAIDGTIFLGNGPVSSLGTWSNSSRLTVQPGDTIRLYSPGYDNLYSSGRIVSEFILP